MRIAAKITWLRIAFWGFIAIEITLLLKFLFGGGFPSNYGAKGILLNIIGVLITFLFAFPQESYSEGVGIGLEEMTPIPFEGGRLTVKDFNELQRKMAKVHRRLSLVGLSYLLAGLIFQFVQEIGRTNV